jgi:hypothetical protein
MSELRGCELMPLRNSVSFLQAAATAGRRRVLGNEDRVIPPWRLPPVVRNGGGRQPPVDQLTSLLHHMRQPPALKVRKLSSLKTKLPAEGRALETGEHLVQTLISIAACR